MQETKERFFVFIGKLEDKMKEFAEASIPELIELNNADNDDRMSYSRLKAAVLGQLQSIMQKAQEVREEKITYYPFSNQNFEQLDQYYQFRNECYDRFNQLENLHRHYREKIEETDYEDYEIKYKRILDEYEAIKNQFTCTQCSSPILIDKIYFVTTYITCPACATRNTFEPSTQSKQLEHLGRSIAEQRTKHLLKECEVSEHRSPELYEKYLRAMFDEWNKINPDMAQEHEKFYNRLLLDNSKYQ